MTENDKNEHSPDEDGETAGERAPEAQTESPMDADDSPETPKLSTDAEADADDSPDTPERSTDALTDADDSPEAPEVSTDALTDADDSPEAPEVSTDALTDAEDSPEATTDAETDAEDSPKASTDAETDAPADEDAPEPRKPPAPFPIVCLGASAGGLQALESFFSALPPDSGLAYVVIIHTAPSQKTFLPEILGRKTKQNIALIEDGMTVEPDTIYVPPADAAPVLEDGVLRLKKRTEDPGRHMPVDAFLRNLARERGDRSGCVILSGTGTDGTQGLRAIKEKGGVIVAQSAGTAEHAGMPNSAVETGMVDFVLDPGEMPSRIVEFFRLTPSERPSDGERASVTDYLSRILSYLANRTRNDFSQYKHRTLIRRIERRMVVTRSRNPDAYLQFLYRNPEEVQALFQELLIGVTSFFRDPEAFGFLKQKVLPDLMTRRPEGAPLRVWIPGCSSGEEVYSMAILLRECMETNEVNRELLVFGTDIDGQAIERGRMGIYPRNIAADVGEERLRRFFSKEGESFRVKYDIREAVVFAEQNILRDPPFIDLDLLVCRNLLIYLNAEAQDRLFPLFHYALKPDGILFLGTSESVNRFPELFKVVHKNHSIYSKRQGAARPRIDFPTWSPDYRMNRRGNGEAEQTGSTGDITLRQAVERELLKHHTPACVVVNRKGELLHVHGRTGRYLELAPGDANLRLAEMAREGLRFALLSALRKAADQGEGEVREPNLLVKTNGGTERVDLAVKCMTAPPLKDCMMVLFHPLPDVDTTAEIKARHPEADEKVRAIEKLEQELLRVRQDYLGAIEELEATNEELRSTNEEMYSSNEELQSTNEELESSREELQSVNEELNTVNSELHGKIAELKETQGAITNVLNNTHIAIIFLDNDLQVRHFTQESSRLIHFINSDIGRPIEHISHNLEVKELPEMIRSVLKNMTVHEEDVRTINGRWYRMRIMCHRSVQGVVEGVVLTFINIDDRKEAEEEQKRMSAAAVASARQYAESIINTVREPLLVLDGDMRVLTANRAFYETFGVEEDETEGRSLFGLGDGQWNIPALHDLLDRIVNNGETFEGYRVEHDVPGVGFKRMLINGRMLRERENNEIRILLAMEEERT